MTMETVINVKCDGENCDHVRSKDTNHWLVGLILGNKLIISTRNKLGDVFSDTGHLLEYRKLDIKDFCGQECTVKWVSKMLSEMRNEKEN